ncbi:hypothetical protein DPMN_180809 [Dreissena polymorpha]|uniref:Uncharacterized protein n=1 Tax=Dreissena polymorpha TaxID=45954 RepID=A0A9D4DB50_DREPO|nr:hypothetical protein DPMN_180809 [Dreissena polymorpha]
MVFEQQALNLRTVISHQILICLLCRKEATYLVRCQELERSYLTWKLCLCMPKIGQWCKEQIGLQVHSMIALKNVH